MSHNQSLTDITTKVLLKLPPIIKKEAPDIVIVQGDTNTAFAGALSAHYHEIPVGHLEAGLRTYKKEPFPEESNRRLISHISTLHFCPTETAANALNKEGIHSNIHIVGNTVVDALHIGKKALGKTIETNRHTILVTCHRRENIGKNLENICDALIEICKKDPGINILFPTHLNQNIQTMTHRKLGSISQIKLCAPLNYPDMVHELNACKIVLTDSGGIQEEAASIGKPVLILRNHTERIEGINTNISKLVGTDPSNITNHTMELLTNETAYKKMATPSTIYGTGNSSQTIMDILITYLTDNNQKK